MPIKIGRITFRPLEESEAYALLKKGILKEKEIKNLEALSNLLTEASRRIIRKQMDQLGEVLQAAGQVYHKYRDKYEACLIPDPVRDIGLPYLHPTEGRKPEEGRELLLIAIKNTDLILKIYPAVRKERMQESMQKLKAVKKRVSK